MQNRVNFWGKLEKVFLNLSLAGLAVMIITPTIVDATELTARGFFYLAVLAVEVIFVIVLSFCSWKREMNE